eukprot:4783677-Pyramimonas_sp.AAC.1
MGCRQCNAMQSNQTQRNAKRNRVSNATQYITPSAMQCASRDMQRINAMQCKPTCNAKRNTQCNVHAVQHVLTWM